MDSTTLVSTVIGAIGALAPAILLISSHYKKLRDEVVLAKTEFSTGVAMLKQELPSGSPCHMPSPQSKASTS